MSTHANRVKMTVTSVASSGTGDITLNAASTGFRSFATAYGANATVDILITEGTAWEIARNCTYTHSGTTVSRGTLESSSTDSAVAFTSAAVVSVIATAAFGNRIEEALDLGFTAVTNTSTTVSTWAGAGNVVLTTCFNSVTLNPNTWWDTTNKKFLPTRAGKYLCTISVLVDNAAAATYNPAIVLNGSTYYYGAPTTTDYTTMQMSYIISMNGSSDYVQAGLYAGNASGTRSAANSANFNAVYLGA